MDKNIVLWETREEAMASQHHCYDLYKILVTEAPIVYINSKGISKKHFRDRYPLGGQSNTKWSDEYVD